MINNNMLYSLSKLYNEKVLHRQTAINEAEEAGVSEEDIKKTVTILSDGLKMILNIIDNPSTEDTEKLLDSIRTEAMNVLIDAGIQKD